jgi:hypothetical protein
MAGPTARTLALLRRRGYQAAVVEKWIPRLNLRSDLWRFGDVLAVHDHRDPRFLIVQCTTLPNVASRLKKALECPELRTWLRAGGAFEVHGWSKRTDKCHAKIINVQAEDLATVVVQGPTRRPSKARQPELFDFAPAL